MSTSSSPTLRKEREGWDTLSTVSERKERVSSGQESPWHPSKECNGSAGMWDHNGSDYKQPLTTPSHF